MSTDTAREEAVTLLEQIGLREYEARCFVGLIRLSGATAKQLSEHTEVPRTRVYDAVRILETKGLVEIQHTTPQRFRPLPIREAIAVMQSRYEDHFERLEGVLAELDSLEVDADEGLQDAWTLTGRETISDRACHLVDGATDEVVLVVGEESVLDEELVDALNAVGDGVDVFLGAFDESLRDRVGTLVPDATTFVSDANWLRGVGPADGLTIGHLLMIDRSMVFASTLSAESDEAHAIFSSGFENGFVVIARRLLSHGLDET